VLDALERDPAFSSFTLDGQAIVLEDYVDARPENEDRLRALLKAGRIEVGPSYVLPDEFLVGAEPLVRNLLLGRSVCERFGARPSPAGYLPDSFGHPAQLPQILTGFGIGSMIFSRGLGDELDTAGVVFRWRAPDGSEVLAFQQLPDYSNFGFLDGVQDAQARVRSILEQFDPALQRAGVEDVLLCNGSDHAPVLAGLPRLCSELEQRFDGSTFAISRYRDYVDAVGPIEAPVVTGELLGSRLQNVLRRVNSARMYIKAANERAEQRLLATETLAALRALSDRTPFPGGDFRLAWRELLRCHPHDTICGCSCDEVHVDALARYESLHRTLSVLEQRGLGRVAGAGPDAVGVFNPLPFRRRCVIEAPGAEPAVAELEGFATTTVELRPEAGRMSPPPGAARIESDRFSLEAAPDGTLTLTDARDGHRYERLHSLEDEPDVGDLYNFCPVAGARIWRPERIAARVLRAGPLVSEIELVVETDVLSVTTVARLVNGSDRIEFRTTIDNRAPDHRLRVVFAAGAATGPVRAEGHFAVIHRPLVPVAPMAPWIEPPDPTAHTCGVVAVGPLALITKGLPEYEARVASGHMDLYLTLLRCVGVISQPAGLPTRPRCAGPPVSTPGGQCLGRHEFEYALLPGADRLDDLALLRASQDYRRGFVTVPGRFELTPALTLEGEVAFSCLKGAEDADGLILRCFNPAPSPTRARITCDLTASATRLDETGEQPLTDGLVELGPGQIATVRLRS
jgi:alpha-mannosidase